MSCSQKEKTIKRYILKIDKKSNETEFLPLHKFDLNVFRNVLDIAKDDLFLRKSYRLHEQVLEKLRGYFPNPNTFDFNSNVYFIESILTEYPDSIMKLSWRKAVQDLSINCEFDVELEHQLLGRCITPTILIRYFGSRNGTALLPMDVDDWIIDYWIEHDFYIVAVDEVQFENYDRDFFIKFLDSLGWYGDESKSQLFAYSLKNIC